jgi:hypothetical protein
VAATAADFPTGKAEPTKLGKHPMRRRQRRMRGNLPGPEGLARTFARTQPLTIAWAIGSVRWGVLASAPPHGSDVAGRAQLHRTDIRPCQRGSREILRQAPGLPATTGAPPALKFIAQRPTIWVRRREAFHRGKPGGPDNSVTCDCSDPKRKGGGTLERSASKAPPACPAGIVSEIQGPEVGAVQ